MITHDVSCEVNLALIVIVLFCHCICFLTADWLISNFGFLY